MGKQLPSYEGIQITGDDESTPVEIVKVGTDPSTGLGKDAPIGSLALSPTGRYGKIGSGDTDWEVIPTGTAGSSGNVPFCFSDGTEANIPLVDGKLPFCLSDGIEANITLV